MTRWLETDSLSNQNIASGLAIGAYTADADRLILCQFFADQVAGNGDYDFWLTHQIAGSGSSYRYVPKTTATVASGVTAIAGQSIMVAVRSGDVLTAYLDGLAGDTTTPDTTVRWFEMAALRPATADRTLAVDASGLVDLVDAPNATAAAAIAAAGWAYTPRTLTQTAAAVASVMAGTSLTITRGDTLSATLTGLGNITGYANLWFTVKWATSDLDAAAIIQIDTDTGLLTVNGAAATATAGNGSITVDDATAGDITIALEASVTDDLTPATGLVYDVQWQSGTSIYTLTSGVAVVSADVTRAVA